MKLSEATKRFKENSAIIVSTKEKENEDTSMTEEELYKVKRISMKNVKITCEPLKYDIINFQRDNNQKFGLLEALLRIGEWTTFRKICNKLPQTYVMSQYPISYNLCQLIHLLIDPIYRK